MCRQTENTVKHSRCADRPRTPSNTADVQKDREHREHKEQKRKGETKGQGDKDGERQEATHSAYRNITVGQSAHCTDVC